MGVPISRTLTRSDLSKLSIAGNSGTMTVKIYDMQYDAENVPPGITEDQRNLLPPSMTLYGSGRASTVRDPASWVDPGSAGRTVDGDVLVGNGGNDEGRIVSGSATNAGVYLIRAYLTTDQRERPTMLDTAVIQANNPE